MVVVEWFYALYVAWLRRRTLRGKLENLTDNGLIDRMMAGEKEK